MKVGLFSGEYAVRELNDDDIDDVYELCRQNTLYYDFYPPQVTREIVQDEMKVLPPGKTPEDKYYIGFFRDGKLIAVMDFIDGYPDDETAFIGFFMTDVSEQNKGVGTGIIEYLCGYLPNLGFKSVRLAWVKGNFQSEHFWLKNHFVPIAEKKNQVAGIVILAERLLSDAT